MPIPASAKKFDDTMDPSDKVDYLVDLTPLLADGEEFTSIDLAVMAESVLLGFKIETDAPYAPSEPTPGQILIWAGVETGDQADSGWAGGVFCGIEFTGVTDSSPPRTFQRTVAIQVIQK